MNETRREVYRLALEKRTGTEIAKAIGISRQAVSKHLLALVRDGYIRPLGEKSRPRLYRRTRKPLPAMSTTDHRGWSPVVRGHRTGRHFKVTAAPSRGWPWSWERTWVRSGVKYHVVRNQVIATDQGRVPIKALRYIEGPNSSSITIWTDDDHIVDGFQLLAHDDYATEVSILAINELAKRTGLRVGLPSIIQPTEYAIEAPPGVVDVAVDEGLETPTTHYDRSKGDGEIETTDKEVALTWLHLNDHLETLRRGIQSIRDDMATYAETNNETVEEIAGAIKHLDERTRVLAEPVEIIDDPWEGMYG